MTTTAGGDEYVAVASYRYDRYVRHLARQDAALQVQAIQRRSCKCATPDVSYWDLGGSDQAPRAEGEQEKQDESKEAPLLAMQLPLRCHFTTGPVPRSGRVLEPKSAKTKSGAARRSKTRAGSRQQQPAVDGDSGTEAARYSAIIWYMDPSYAQRPPSRSSSDKKRTKRRKTGNENQARGRAEPASCCIVQLLAAPPSDSTEALAFPDLLFSSLEQAAAFVARGDDGAKFSQATQTARAKAAAAKRAWESVVVPWAQRRGDAESDGDGSTVVRETGLSVLRASLSGFRNPSYIGAAERDLLLAVASDYLPPGAVGSLPDPGEASARIEDALWFLFAARCRRLLEQPGDLLVAHSASQVRDLRRYFRIDVVGRAGNPSYRRCLANLLRDTDDGEREAVVDPDEQPACLCLGSPFHLDVSAEALQASV